MQDVTGSSDRRSPSLSPRKGNNHASSSAAAFRQSDRQSDRDLLRPESASLLPQGNSGSSRTLRPPTFDGVEVAVVERTEDAAPSKRLRNDGNGGGGGGGGGSHAPPFLPAWAGGALHLTTAVVGVGILGLPRALADLGWPGGMAFMASATAGSLYTALLLVELCSEGGGGGGELGGGASSSSAVGGEEACSRSPPPPPEPLLHPLPPPSSSSSSLSNGSFSSGVVGRRGSNQDLQSLTESESSRRSKRRGGAGAAATGSTTAAAAAAESNPLSCPSSSGGSGSSGSRYETYGAVARATLGPRAGGAVASMQLLACAGLAVTYCVTGGASLHSLTGGGLGLSPAAWALLFGLAQFPVAVAAPDLERLAGVSAGGALASLLYASAAVAASARVLLLAARNAGEGAGSSLSPPENPSSPWRVLDAASTILFAFGGHFVLPEIAASLSNHPPSSPSSSSPSPSPSPQSPMFPAVKASYLAVALSYFSVAASGAAAFGDRVADDVLLSDRAGPAPLIAAANAAVCLHVAAGFHVFSQPCYSGFEAWFEKKQKWWWRKSGGGGPPFSSLTSSSGDPKAAPSLPRTTAEAAAAAAAAPAATVPTTSTHLPPHSAVAARFFYVLLVAAAAAALPFFSVCMALVGALAFAPATFVLPPAFAFFSRSPAMRRDKRKRALHGAMALSFGVLSLACSVSAARGLVVALQSRLRGLAV